MKNDEMKYPPCPKCGSNNVVEDGYFSCVVCLDCGEYYEDKNDLLTEKADFERKKAENAT